MFYFHLIFPSFLRYIVILFIKEGIMQKNCFIWMDKTAFMLYLILNLFIPFIGLSLFEPSLKYIWTGPFFVFGFPSFEKISILFFHCVKGLLSTLSIYIICSIFAFSFES